MEEWQQKHITANLPQLLRTTNCNQLLLSILESEGVLGHPDIQALEVLQVRDEKTRKLYDIVTSRSNSYSILVKALHATSQSGAFDILNKELIKHQQLQDPHAEDLSWLKFATPIEPVVEFLDSINSSNLLVVSTLDPEITRKRLEQTVKYLHVHDFKNGRIDRHLESLSDPDVIVLICEKIRPILSHRVIKSSKCKILLVTSETVEDIEIVKKSYSSVVVTVKDHVVWRDLQAESKTILENNNVTFQGKQLRLKDVLHAIPADLINSNVKAQFLIDLLHNRSPEIVNNSVPPSLSYYIERKLVTRRRIMPSIFDTVCPDIFVIKGIQLHQMSQIVSGRDTDTSGNQRKSVTVRFIALEIDEDYDKICQLTSCPVHLLQYDEDKLYWLQTKGCLKVVQKFVHENDVLDEGSFLEECLRSPSPVCIFDTPGMGKSVLLAHFAENVMNKFPSRVVCFIVLREFMQEIKTKRGINADVICRAIASQASTSEIGRLVVETGLKSKNVPCELFLDGFDEVLSHQVPEARKLFERLKSLEKTRLYVTTRPHMRAELEQFLSVLGYNMVPFEDQNQIQFLVKYWAGKGAVVNEALQSFANHCLTQLKKGMTDFERDIAGIPLQCSLLAEVHLDDALRYSSHPNLCQFNDALKVTSVAEMYEQYITIGFDRYVNLNVKLGLRDTIRNFFKKGDLRDQMKRRHMFHALELISPASALTFMRQLIGNENPTKLNPLVFVAGVLETRGDESGPRFVHRTFSEYLVALFIVDCLTNTGRNKKIEEPFVKFLFQDVLATTEKFDSVLSLGLGSVDQVESASFQFPVIVYFFNFLLSSDFEHIFPPIPLADIIDADYYVRMFSAAVINDYAPIANFLLQIKSDQIYSSSAWSTVSLLAAKYCGKEMVKLTFEVMEQTKQVAGFPEKVLLSQNPEFTVTPLHVAVQAGKFQVVQYLLNTSQFTDQQNCCYLLHLCVNGSASEDPSVIEAKAQIIRLLCGTMKPDMLNELLPTDQTTALLQPGAHLSLVKELILGGLSVNVRTPKKECVLHTIFSHFGPDNLSPQSTPSDFHELVQLLADMQFAHFDTPNESGATPLHAAVKVLEPEAKTLDYFGDPVFKAGDHQGDTVLFNAIQYGRNPSLIQGLVERGALLDHRNSNGENSLHIAAKQDRLEAVQYLVEKDISLLKSQDHQGNTPLHLAMLKRTPGHERVQILLIQSGADVTALNAKGYDPFSYALTNGKGVSLGIYDYMKNVGYSMNKKTASKGLKGLLCNGNISVWEWDQELVFLAELLISQGGIIRCKKSETPWKLEQVVKNWKKVVASFQLTDGLTQKLRKLCPPLENEEDLVEYQTADCLFDCMQRVDGSFECLMISLISCGAGSPFLLLRQCLQSDDADDLVFVTPPPGFNEFLESEKKHLLILESFNCGMSVTRIRNTIDTNIHVIRHTGESAFDHLLPDRINVVQCSNSSGGQLISKIHNPQINHHNVVCIVLEEGVQWAETGNVSSFRSIYNSSFDEVTMTSKDEVTWGDLAKSVQTSLEDLVLRSFRNTELVHVLKSLVNRELLSVVQMVCGDIKPRGQLLCYPIGGSMLHIPLKLVGNLDIFNEGSEVLKIINVDSATRLAAAIKRAHPDGLIFLIDDKGLQGLGSMLGCTNLLHIFLRKVRCDFVIQGLKVKVVEREMQRSSLGKGVHWWVVSDGGEFLGQRFVTEVESVTKKDKMKYMMTCWDVDQDEVWEHFANWCLGAVDHVFVKTDNFMVWNERVLSDLSYHRDHIRNPEFYCFLLANCFKLVGERRNGDTVAINSVDDLWKEFVSIHNLEWDEDMTLALGHTALLRFFPEWIRLKFQVSGKECGDVWRSPFVEIRVGTTWFVREEVAWWCLTCFIVSEFEKSDMDVDLVRTLVEVDTNQRFVYPWFSFSLNILVEKITLPKRLISAMQMGQNANNLAQAFVLSGCWKLLPVINEKSRNWDVADHLVSLAVWEADLVTVKYMCQTYRKIGKLITDISVDVKEERVCLLQLAVHRGNVGIVEYLLNDWPSVMMQGMCLLHWCVRWSATDNEVAIKRKEVLALKLLEIIPGLINEKDELGRTAWLADDVHKELIQALLHNATEMS